jgi:hypothetical protein
MVMTYNEVNYLAIFQDLISPSEVGKNCTIAVPYDYWMTWVGCCCCHMALLKQLRSYVCLRVRALHGYRAPRVIWSTSLRRSGLVGRRNWQFHALLFLPQTSTLKTPQTRHHLYISYIDEVAIPDKKALLYADVFVPKVSRQIPCFLLQTRQRPRNVY